MRMNLCSAKTRLSAALLPSLLASLLAAAAAAGSAGAQGAYPNKPIRWIVPASAGGPGDIVARTIGTRLSEIFGQQILVDNRAGAAGQLGLGIAALAAPDGYTVVNVNAAFAIHESLYSKLPYNASKDFAAVTQTPSSDLLLLSIPSLPAKTPKELIALAKAKPGQITFASSGNGSPQHLGMELFSSMTGIKMVHVPYKGPPQAITDLLGGQVSTGIVSLSATLPLVRSGKLNAMGVTSLKRSAFAPDIPTVAELGLPGFEIEFWMGVLVPAAVPRDIVTRLNSEIVKVLQMPDIMERFREQGFTIFKSTPQQFDAFIKAEIKKWAKIVKESGAKPD
jgi:tripartite-type tricarboxylate transporter receptor subunit TctC